MPISKASKISIINGIVLFVITLLEYTGTIKFALLFSYEWHKMLHILGVILFMGNMIVGPMWFLYAFYSGNENILKFANKLLQLTDLFFTIPGIALTVINGLFLASVYGGSAKIDWLFYSIFLLFLMWVISIPLIIIQEKIYIAIETESTNVFDINKLLISWGIVGSFVMIPPSIIFYLMVVKPM